jgi:hypothetical protein
MIDKIPEERHLLYRKFWTSLLDRAKATTELHAAVSPSNCNWINTGAGKSGLDYKYVVTEHGSRVELYIRRGRSREEENKAFFDVLERHKEQIEMDFGGPLSWERLDNKGACRIAKHFEIGGYRDDESSWPAIQDTMIGAMTRLEKALRPHIAKLKGSVEDSPAVPVPQSR